MLNVAISLVLKENKTLIREAAEREAKKRRRKVWVQLPDRPIIYQHQFYCW